MNTGVIRDKTAVERTNGAVRLSLLHPERSGNAVQSDVFTVDEARRLVIDLLDVLGADVLDGLDGLVNSVRHWVMDPVRHRQNERAQRMAHVVDGCGLTIRASAPERERLDV